MILLSRDIYENENTTDYNSSGFEAYSIEFITPESSTDQV